MDKSKKNTGGGLGGTETIHDENAFTKPQKDVLQDILDCISSLSHEMNGKLTTLQNGMNTLTSVVAPNADRVAERLTVAILLEGVSTPKGHGLLLRGRPANAAFDSDSDTERFYLMSAAHVLVEFKEGTNLKLRWTGSGEFSCTAKKLFLDTRYVINGECDVGILEVSLSKNEGEVFDDETVEWTNRSLAGRTAVGHGLIYMKGEIVLDGQEFSRPMINAMSMGGCSGCPLFTPSVYDEAGTKTHFFAVVHGESKHRHSRHSAGSDSSSKVFVDKLLDDFSLKQVKGDTGIRDSLCAAEDVMLDTDLDESYPTSFVLSVAENEDTIEHIKPEKRRTIGALANVLKHLNHNAGQGISINGDFKILAVQAFEAEDTDNPCLDLFNMSEKSMTCVFPRKNTA